MNVLTVGSDDGIGVALALLRSDLPFTIMGAPEDWPRWRTLLPHVLAVIGHVDRQADAPPSQLDDCSWLLDRAGTYSLVHGRPGAARPLMERALTITEATYGPEHPTVAARLSTLALVLLDLGDPGAARPLAERALTIDEATYGPEHPTVAILLSNLAAVLRDLGEADAAERLDERAVSIRARRSPTGGEQS
jgi:tetratricopeptide (TPR) repeat protein